MKVYVVNYNGILDRTIEKLKASGELTTNYHEADVFLLWQDIRGDCARLADIAKNHLGKPVVVVQHGRGATRDYCIPNNFKLQADLICVWGEAERERLLSVGIPDEKITVVGCPLFQRLKPKTKAPEREGLNVLYVPVITSKEEPENLLGFAALKKWECDKLIANIQTDFDKYKSAWATEENRLRRFTDADGKNEDRLWKQEIIPRLPRYVTYGKGLVNVKLTGVHDLYQYQAPVIMTQQNDPNHVAATADLLANTDIMVCLEEGTMQLLAHALDIPVVYLDIFKYGTYGGVADYDRVEKIQTTACYVVKKLERLGNAIDNALSKPHELTRNRIQVCEYEGGAHLGDSDENIIAAVRAIASPVETKEPAAV